MFTILLEIPPFFPACFTPCELRIHSSLLEMRTSENVKIPTETNDTAKNLGQGTQIVIKLTSKSRSSQVSWKHSKCHSPSILPFNDSLIGLERWNRTFRLDNFLGPPPPISTWLGKVVVLTMKKWWIN
jgi:hypothetical protein